MCKSRGEALIGVFLGRNVCKLFMGGEPHAAKIKKSSKSSMTTLRIVTGTIVTVRRLPRQIIRVSKFWREYAGALDWIGARTGEERAARAA